MPVFTYVDSYSILAPNAVPSGFVDGKVASEKVLAALNLGDNYRIGHTKVFFKAGILGQLEEMREEKLSSIFANFQARIRGYLIRKNYTKLCDQRWDAILVAAAPLRPVSGGRTEIFYWPGHFSAKPAHQSFPPSTLIQAFQQFSN